MAISTNLEGRRRASAIAADGNDPARARRFKKAKRHSFMVRVLRWAMPIGVLGIAGYYAAALLAASDLGSRIARETLPKIVPANLVMKNPRYRGFNKDGGAYDLRARDAHPHADNSQLIMMHSVVAELTQPNGARTEMTAHLASYDLPTQNITLNRKVEFKSSSGGWARLKNALIEHATGTITSKDPVELGNAAMTITAKQMKISQKSREMKLTGSVVAQLKPPQSDAAAKPAAPADKPPGAPTPARAAAAEAAAGGAGATEATPQPPGVAGSAASAGIARMFTAGKGPVQISADRLDLDDVKKTAVFIGMVKARQGETEMTTPELRIAYSGAPSAGLTGEAAAGNAAADTADATGAAAKGGARITSIVAAEPVSITQAPAIHVAGKTAAFDAATQRATLDGGITITRAPDTRITGQTAGFDDIQNIAHIDGNVVMSQGSDRRVNGDHAEFHSATEIAIVTGAVVLTSGPNVLRGGRLVVEQKAGRMQLTGGEVPAGGKPGRIGARFVQADGKSQGGRAQTGAQTTGAFGTLSSFRTDPSAPVDIVARELEVLDHKSLANFRGDVEVQQGDFKVRTGELNAHYTGSAGIASMAAPTARDATEAERKQGAAARLTHLRAPTKVVITSRNGQSAAGDWADFDMTANTVTMGGDVVLTQGRNVVKGSRLVLDLTTGESVIKTENPAAPWAAAERPAGGWRAERTPSRPSAVFYPQELRDAAAGAGASAAATKPAAASAPATTVRGAGPARPQRTPSTSGWQSTTSGSGND